MRAASLGARPASPRKLAITPDLLPRSLGFLPLLLILPATPFSNPLHSRFSPIRRHLIQHGAAVFVAFQQRKRTSARSGISLTFRELLLQQQLLGQHGHFLGGPEARALLPLLLLRSEWAMMFPSRPSPFPDLARPLSGGPHDGGAGWQEAKARDRWVYHHRRRRWVFPSATAAACEPLRVGANMTLTSG